MSEDMFKKNGGYFIDGVAYMDCRETGEPVANVSLNAVSVLCSSVLTKKCLSLLSESERDRLFNSGGKRASGVTRPRGWKWMKEFVDAKGNVYHKGPVTDIVAIKAKQKANKEKRRVAENKKLLKMAKEKKELKKAIEAQKDFLDHKAGKK